MDKQYAHQLYYANPHPKTHAIIAAMLGQEPRTPQRFVGKAIITSDGFCQCNFIDADGVSHHGAFVGSWEQVEDNIQLVAEELSIPEEQTAELLRSWIGQDYRPANHMRGALGI